MMNETVSRVLSSLRLGPPKSFAGIHVVPLLAEKESGPEYLTLTEALSQELVTITEISASGSVPELLVKNSAGLPVLILDGEELIGARQNRVLNTTVLLRERSETTVPVSCTERGRWSYTSSRFDDSGIVMAKQARSMKSRSVSDALRDYGRARADQGQVWDQISVLDAKLGTNSRTGAMRDSYTRYDIPLQERLGHFACQEKQTGLLALAEGKVIGLDLLSRSSAYKHVHAKLLKSYIVDLLGTPLPEDFSGVIQVTEVFIASLGALFESAHSSVGYGTDFRYESPRACGSALVHADTAVHAAFFVDGSVTTRYRDRSAFNADSGSCNNTTNARAGGTSRPIEGRPARVNVRPSRQRNYEATANTTEVTSREREEQEKQQKLSAEKKLNEQKRREAREVRQASHQNWMNAFLRLPPGQQLELIAWDVSHPIGYFPTECATIASDVIDAMEEGVSRALYEKIKDLRKTEWKQVADMIRGRHAGI